MEQTKRRRPYGHGELRKRIRNGKTYFIARVSKTRYGRRQVREIWCRDEVSARLALRKLGGNPSRRPIFENLGPVNTGYVYFIRAVGTEFVKIGFAENIAFRLSQLQCACPHELRVIGAVAGTAEIELALHKRFKHLSVRNEWFRYEADLRDFVKSLEPFRVSAVEDFGVSLTA